MSFARALGMRLLRIVIFGGFLLGIGVGINARNYWLAGAFVAGLFAFFAWWLRVDAEKCAVDPNARPERTE